MKRQIAASTIFALLYALCAHAVHAQQSRRIPTVGFLIPSSQAGFAARVEAFRQGCRELGYTEGKNIVIDYRWAEGDLNRLAELAAELVLSKVNV